MVAIVSWNQGFDILYLKSKVIGSMTYIYIILPSSLTYKNWIPLRNRHHLNSSNVALLRDSFKAGLQYPVFLRLYLLLTSQVKHYLPFYRI